MKPLNKCQVCGKSVQGSLLCETCEKEVLEKQKGRRTTLTLITGIVLVGIIYLFWTEYSKKQSQVDPSIITSALNSFVGMVSGFMGSPYAAIPAILIFIIAAFIIGLKIAK
jgi:predicted nucleic acid-binding Zn ribbon protein